MNSYGIGSKNCGSLSDVVTMCPSQGPSCYKRNDKYLKSLVMFDLKVSSLVGYTIGFIISK